MTRSRSLTAPSTGTRASSRFREVQYQGLTWVDITEPGAAEVTHLRERFQIGLPGLDDMVLGRRPLVDLYAASEQLVVSLYVPSLDQAGRVVTSAVTLIAGRSFVITVQVGDLKPLRRIFAAAAADEAARTQLMARGAGYLLYRIVHTIARQCFPILYRIEEELTQLAAQAGAHDGAALVGELGALREDALTMQRIVGPDVVVVQSLSQLKTGFLQIDEGQFFGVCVAEFDRVIDSLAGLKERIGGVQATIDGQALQRISRHVRVAAILLAALLPLLLLASLAGLEVVVSFAADPLIFLAGVLIVVALAAGFVALLHYRRVL